MLILPQLFFGGSGADIIAISTSGSRPVKGSKSGASWRDLGSNFEQISGNFSHVFSEVAKIGSEVFICNQSGELFKTNDFSTFTKINIVSVIFGTSGNFPTQATLFSVGSRLYAAYRGFSPPSTNAPVIAYSDDLGLNWTFGGMPVPASGANFKNWVNIGDYFYTSLLNPNNFNNRLYRFNKTNFSDKGEVSNSSLVLQSWLFVKGTRLFTLNGLNFAFTDNPLSGATDISSILPSGFAGYCMTERNIGGTLRQIIIGRRSDTGRLAIIYSNNSPTSSWTYASIPNISITSSEVGKMKVISLSKQEGFVASYIDTTDNTPSGILYSADGITWTEADAGTLTNYLNIMVNPLII